MIIASSYSKIPDGSQTLPEQVCQAIPARLAVLVPSLLLQLAGQFDTPVEYLWSGSKAYNGSESLTYSLVSFANDLLLVSAPFLVMVYGASLRAPLSAEMLVTPAHTIGVEILFYALAPVVVTRGWTFLTGCSSQRWHCTWRRWRWVCLGGPSSTTSSQAYWFSSWPGSLRIAARCWPCRSLSGLRHGSEASGPGGSLAS